MTAAAPYLTVFVISLWDFSRFLAPVSQANGCARVKHADDTSDADNGTVGTVPRLLGGSAAPCGFEWHERDTLHEPWLIRKASRRISLWRGIAGNAA